MDPSHKLWMCIARRIRHHVVDDLIQDAVEGTTLARNGNVLGQVGWRGLPRQVTIGRHAITTLVQEFVHLSTIFVPVGWV